MIVEFGDIIDRHILEQVAALEQTVAQLHVEGQLPGLIETVPTFRSLAIIVDPLTTSPSIVRKCIENAPSTGKAHTPDTRHWSLPVSYGGNDGPDIESLSESIGLEPAEIITRHHQVTYSVYMLGFLPGYAFMGDIDHSLRQPRRRQPRTRVPEGSVAIANQLTAVYPWESPGGWHLLGYCPVPLFDNTASVPALLAPGDKVSFRPVTAAEAQDLAADLAAGKQQSSNYLLPS